MSTVTPSSAAKLPTHLDLPFEDKTVPSNLWEHPTSLLLTDSILPYLEKRHPGMFVIAQDSFIYYQLTGPQDYDCRAPDWFLVVGVPRLLDGRVRNSYVMWQEHIVPTIVLEFVSDGDSTAEYDRTPRTGKFWIYEQAIRAPYYGIFDPARESLEVYFLYAGSYQLLTPNEHGRHLIASLGLELGFWRGSFFGADTVWPRWWHAHSGDLLLIGHEAAALIEQQAAAERQRAEAERQQAEAERRLAEAERQANEKLKDKLRSLGIDPDTL